MGKKYKEKFPDNLNLWGDIGNHDDDHGDIVSAVNGVSDSNNRPSLSELDTKPDSWEDISDNNSKKDKDVFVESSVDMNEDITQSYNIWSKVSENFSSDTVLIEPESDGSDETVESLVEVPIDSINSIGKMSKPDKFGITSMEEVKKRQNYNTGDTIPATGVKANAVKYMDTAIGTVQKAKNEFNNSGSIFSNYPTINDLSVDNEKDIPVILGFPNEVRDKYYTKNDGKCDYSLMRSHFINKMDLEKKFPDKSNLRDSVENIAEGNSIKTKDPLDEVISGLASIYKERMKK